MRMLVLVALTSCGAPAPATPVSHHAEPLAAAVARLPRSIVSIEALPLAWLSSHPDDQFGMDPACWAKLRPRIAGYYVVDQRPRPKQEGVFHAYAMHTDLTTAELRACRTADPDRREAADRRILVGRDSGFFPVLFAQIAPGWVYCAGGQYEIALDAVTSMLREPATTTNPLAEVVAAVDAERFFAAAADVTGELVDVSSRGAWYEVVDGDATPARGAVLFANEADARRALAAIPPSAEPEVLERFRAEVARTAEVTGASVVYRGVVDRETADVLRGLLDRALPPR